MELSFRISKPQDFVFDYLTDMQKFESVHPVITKIEKTGDENYLVYETLKLGFIPFSFNYPATIETRKEEMVVIIRAIVMRLTKVEMTFVLIADQGTTIVKENIRIKSLLPIQGIIKREFKKQHQQLFRNIEMLIL